MKQAFRVLLLALFTLLTARASIAQIGISVSFGPPALPVYEQPICPGDGYLWTPGYWAWDADVSDYYWIPGTWILAPEPGFLWTPGYWGWGGGGYLFHEGFWGTEVGFYGGINYGFGYFGTGFYGGRWDHDHFFYNTAVMHVNEVSIHNVYVDRTVIHNTTINRVSYNGGQGGIDRRPSPEEDRAAQGRHVPPVAAQTQHAQEARSNPDLRASHNQGKPPIAATARPGELKGEGAVPAREAGGEYHPAPNQGRNEGEGAHPGAGPGGTAAAPGHAKDLQPHEVTAPAGGGDAKDQKYQQQQQKLVDKQNKEHEKLQAQQEKDDQKAQKSQNQQRQQMMEQQHQRQTQQMEERHSQQTQQMQERQAPRRPH